MWFTMSLKKRHNLLAAILFLLGVINVYDGNLGVAVVLFGASGLMAAEA